MGKHTKVTIHIYWLSCLKFNLCDPQDTVSNVDIHEEKIERIEESNPPRVLGEMCA
jgi:hypothetical protein